MPEDKSPRVTLADADDSARCVHLLFEQQVLRTPNALAVEFAGKSLTYRELNRRANQLAHYLVAHGIGPDSLVGVLLDRSIDLVVAVYATLKAGAAVVPLDPKFPVQRLDQICEQARLSTLLTTLEFCEVSSRLKAGKIVNLDVDVRRFDNLSEVNPVCQVGADDLVYVLFTSGSTGQPKGVAMVHGAIANLLLWHRRYLPLQQRGSRVLQFSSLTFDVAYQEIFSTGCDGGTLVLMDDTLRIDAAALWEYLCAQRIARIFLPFVALQQLAEAASLSDNLPEFLAEVITAGEQLRITDSLRRLFSRLPQARLHNHYGPTETHVVTAYTLDVDTASWGSLPPIGKPISNVEAYVLDESGKLITTPGQPGELYIGGACLARGYLHRAQLTEERFIPDRISGRAGARVYRTGDQVSYLADGNLQFLGRGDDQVKIRGHRVELGEIEIVLSAFPGISSCAVSVTTDREGAVLEAFYCSLQGESIPEAKVRDFLRSRLPEYLVPTFLSQLDRLPLTASGKVDRRALRRNAPSLESSASNVLPATSGLEEAISQIWREVLGLKEINFQDNFFDVGGHSLLLGRVQRRVREVCSFEVSVVDLLRFSTVASLAEHLRSGGMPNSLAPSQPSSASTSAAQRESIAIIGMAGQFPGAPNIEQLWQNLCAGKEGITTFSDKELLAAGMNPADLGDPFYVKSRGVLAEPEHFDASFFGFTAREAEISDPQQRLFLETCWQAFEDGGYDPSQVKGAVGVYAGSSLNTYFLGKVLADSQRIAEFVQAFQVSQYPSLVGNDKDYLASRVAYKLNLRGPAVSVQTACSTSLVAVCQACADLLSSRCDMALAGGVSISFPQERGYIYQEGTIASSDGHCRAFDAGATGTVFGAGVGVVLLKRLSDAIRDRDHIYATIRSSAVNNDGADKVSFSAPSVNGQAQVIRMAHEQAGISAGSIGYVEAHGTGTALGDPMEIAGLTLAFRATTDRTQYCALGSVKTNLGHLEAAAGVVGLIKSALVVERGLIPPTLHFRQPNPQCGFETSPFYVAAALTAWPQNGFPRLAGVSSFGVGGTNAHVVVEAAPELSPRATPPPPAQLLVWSARSESALEQATQNLQQWLSQATQSPSDPSSSSSHDASHWLLADIAATLQQGRRAFPCRRMLVCSSLSAAVESLKDGNPRDVFSAKADGNAPGVVFMFPGQGSQYVNMGRELYESEPVFRSTVMQVCEVLRPLRGEDLLAILYPAPEREAEAQQRLTQTVNAQPALFAIEYALARLWMSWGIQPVAMVGHSVGETVAAVVAGVMSLEDALTLLNIRGGMMQAQQPGTMLSVRYPEEKLRALLPADVWMAVVNSPTNCVVAGETPAIERFRKELELLSVPARPLVTSHAFHSPMMTPVVKPLLEMLRGVKLNKPRIPIVSTTDGHWVRTLADTDAQGLDWSDPNYWANQVREPVLFSHAIATLASKSNLQLLEVGPGQVLSTLAQQHPAQKNQRVALSSMPPIQQVGESRALLSALGRLWLVGLDVDWSRVEATREGRKLSLPTYPFERRRYSISRSLESVADSGKEAVSSRVISGEPVPQEPVERPPATPDVGSPDVSSDEDLLVRQLEQLQQQLRSLEAGQAATDSGAADNDNDRAPQPWSDPNRFFEG